MSAAWKFRIPASSANLGPGFDALSLALAVYLTVEIEPGGAFDAHRVAPSGVGEQQVSTGADNLIVRVLNRTAERRDRRFPPSLLRVHNEIPLARGMGSSAAAILAGISCYEVLAGERLRPDEVFHYAGEFEPHPDNLAASLFGSLAVSVTGEDGRTVSSRITVPAGAVPVLVTPEFELATERARAALPAVYAREDLVFNIQRAAMIVAAASAGDWVLLAEAMKDRAHQPYRAALIPGLREVLELRPEGLWGAALSGAGPTVLALASPAKAESVGRALAGAFREHGVGASFHVAAIDVEGRRFFS